MQSGSALTAAISFRKTGSVCSLSRVLARHVPAKYYLSDRALRSLLEHAAAQAARGNNFMPTILEQERDAKESPGPSTPPTERAEASAT